MMYLLDTNIFLEILLGQEKKDYCKRFIIENRDRIFISDFSLHSIGVILFRNGKENLFCSFFEDIKKSVRILTLPYEGYSEISKVKELYFTDFDDSYQYLIAKYHGLDIVSMDSDFNKFNDINVLLP